MSSSTTIHSLSRALRVIRNEIDPRATVTQAGILLYIAERGTVYAKEIVEAFGIDVATCSRTLHLFGHRKRNGREKGNFGLVDITQDSEDLRLKKITLSQKGEDFIAGLVNAFLEETRSSD